jgi:hypothetical protein
MNTSLNTRQHACASEANISYRVKGIKGDNG